MEQTRQDVANDTDKVLAFDTLFTTNHIKMLKVLLFYFDPSAQKMLAVLIKFLELQHTVAYFQKHPAPFPTRGQKNADMQELCTALRPYCAPDEQRKLNQILQMQKTMENFQQITQTMEIMKELFPDGMPGFGFGSENDTGDGKAQEGHSSPFSSEMLSSFLGGDNSRMFEMLAAMLNPSD